MLLIFALMSPSAAARPGQTCIDASINAALQVQIPLAPLLAIAMVETGDPQGDEGDTWPWTLHSGGKGHRFATRAEAKRHLRDLYAQGVRNLDIGCFQINLKWHHAGFTSLDDMLDPQQNALYAARFLRQLYTETGDWEAAAAAYHSRTPVHAETYRKKWRLAMSRLGVSQLPGRAPAEAARTAQVHNVTTRYPLLAPGGRSGEMGSLMPTRAGTASVVPLVAWGTN